MKVIFICGSLEIGKDGVGDYTRHLACELIRQNHDVRVVALMDPHVQIEFEGVQIGGFICLPVLRIPSDWPSKKSFALAGQWINSFNPDWISLQFVPYAYNNKGLPVSLTPHLRALSKQRKLHVMFHEGWVGVADRANIKTVVTSLIQKFLIKRMLKITKPKVVHTHIPHYKFQLEKLGCSVATLPLFSNIAIAEQKSNNKDVLTFKVGFFSQVEVDDPTIFFLSALKKKVDNIGRELEIMFIGGNKTKVKIEGTKLESMKDFKGRVKYSGFLMEKDLSHALQDCRLGITSIPRHALGKSGSVAAFLSHGIPVAAPNVQQHYDKNEVGFFSNNLKSAIVFEADLVEIQKSTQSLTETKNEIGLTKIANKFLFDLQHGERK